jgi:hypothetical protein
MSDYSDKIARAKQQGLYKVADLNGKEVTHTISHLLEDYVKFDREMDILCFTDTGKQLQVNLTNGEWLIKNLGEDPNDWSGQRVTLYLAEYKQGEYGIRLKRPDGSVNVGGATVSTSPKRPPKEDLDDDLTY